MPKIILDGREVEFEPGETILKIAWREGVKIPVLCFHPALRPEASCRLCLVEVELGGRGGLLPSCATPAKDGMRVDTRTPKVETEVREGLLSLLLADHPLDCPVCDAGGACDLQNLAQAMGPGRGLAEPEKRHRPHWKIGPLLDFYPDRCVDCTRCVRLYTEVLMGDDWWRHGRGWHITVGPGHDTTMRSPFAGNLADVCPVGAINSADQRSLSRPWENSSEPGVAPEDSLVQPLYLINRVRNAPLTGGVRPHTKRVLRTSIRPSKGHLLWLPDRDRYAHTASESPRLLAPQARTKGGELREVSWEAALELLWEALRDVSLRSPARIGLVTGARSTNRAAELASLLLVKTLGVPNVSILGSEPALEEAYGTHISTASLQDLSRGPVVVFGDPLGEHHPALLPALKDARVTLVGPWAEERVPPAVDRHIPVHPARLYGAALALARGMADGAGVQLELPEAPEAQLAQLGQELAREGGVLVLGDWLPGDVQRALGVGAGAAGLKVLYLRRGSNAAGFLRAGLRMDPGVGADPLELARRGELELLIIWDTDPILYEARPIAEDALRGAGLVVYMAPYPDPSAAYADLVLPLAAPWEEDGVRLSSLGLLVSARAGATPPGQARPAEWVFTELLRRAGVHVPPVAPPEDSYERTPVLGWLPSLEPFSRLWSFRQVEAQAEARMLPLPEPEAEVPNGIILWPGLHLYRSSYHAWRSPHLSGFVPREQVEISPQDAQRMGLGQGDRVVLRGRESEIGARVRINPGVVPGAARVSPAFLEGSWARLLGQKIEINKEGS